MAHISISPPSSPLCTNRRFSNEAEMFEIFPVAGQLLNLLLDEYRSSLIAYSALIPTDDRKVLQNPGTSITHPHTTTLVLWLLWYVVNSTKLLLSLL